MSVEVPIDLAGLSEEIFLGEVLRELEDVGEVASLDPVEQGNDLAARQLTECESRADEAGGGWVFGWGIRREIDQQVVLPWTTSRQNVALPRLGLGRRTGLVSWLRFPGRPGRQERWWRRRG